MAIWKNPGWFDKSGRQKQLDPHFDRTGLTRYGLEEMAAPDKKYAVRRHFDRVADKYDFMNTLLSFGLHYPWKRTAFRMLGVKPGDHVIDVCGGTGDMSVLAETAVRKSGRVVLYDINRKMMTVGKYNRKRKGETDGITCIQGDAEHISFADNRFNAAMVSFGIRNVTHIKAGFSEMYRVLKPGGTFLCLEFSKPVNPVFCRLYDFYSFNIIPILGKLIVGSAKSYALLPETIRMFSLPEELTGLLEDIGFYSVSHRRLLNGIAVAHIGKK